MKNYLIFRTDRIGDFLTTAILIKSIKFNDVNSKIVLVASKNVLIKSATFYKYKGTYYIYGVLWDLQTN